MTMQHNKPFMPIAMPTDEQKAQIAEMMNALHPRQPDPALAAAEAEARNADGESYRDMWLASASNVARVAATANRYREALQEIVASDSPLGRNGVPSHKEIARRALKGIDNE
jgi:hypothetical protein